MDIYSEYLQLARLALSGRDEDVIALLRRAIRRSSSSRSEFSMQLRDAMSGLEETFLRRANVQKAEAEQINPHFLFNADPAGEVHPILPEKVELELEELANEFKFMRQLREANVPPTRSVLFVGPPGVGKSLSALWLADKLNKKLLTVNLASIMSSHLGKTGSNLSGVFEQVKSENVILFIDEIDSLGKSRGDADDIGELKRIVNILLQSLDRWTGDALLIAATNYPELLDRALWRRFDKVIDFPLPNSDDQKTFLRNKFASAQLPVPDEIVDILSIVFENVSIADTELWVNSCVRKSIVRDAEIRDLILVQLVDLCADKSPDTKKVLALKMYRNRISQRKISDYLGMSRDTIRKYVSEIKRMEARK